MQIANPIYDTFFKYLMEDLNLAKKLLAAIIEEDIVSLELRPQELLIDLPEKYMSILRVDFKAVIRTPDSNTKKILIEMQKSRLLFDIMRFRRYLAENYGRQDEIVTQKGNEKETLPIITIYFLNFKLKDVNFPVLKIDRNYTNVVTKEVAQVKDMFIEQLTHDCYTIQIPRLELNMQNRLEKLLAIFNQQYVTTKDNKIMNLPEEWEQDAELLEFINRMHKPLQNPQMVLRATAEDEIEGLFEQAESRLVDAQLKLAEEKAKTLQAQEKALKAQEIALQAEQKLAAQREIALQTEQRLEEQRKKSFQAEQKALEVEQKLAEQKEMALQVEQKLVEQKEMALQALKQSVAKMLEMKVLSTEQIASIQGVSFEFVELVKAEKGL
jgi:hypothetical protein